MKVNMLIRCLFLAGSVALSARTAMAADSFDTFYAQKSSPFGVGTGLSSPTDTNPIPGFGGTFVKAIGINPKPSYISFTLMSSVEPHVRETCLQLAQHYASVQATAALLGKTSPLGFVISAQYHMLNSTVAIVTSITNCSLG